MVRLLKFSDLLFQLSFIQSELAPARILHGPPRDHFHNNKKTWKLSAFCNNQNRRRKHQFLAFESYLGFHCCLKPPVVRERTFIWPATKNDSSGRKSQLINNIFQFSKVFSLVLVAYEIRKQVIVNSNVQHFNCLFNI